MSLYLMAVGAKGKGMVGYVIAEADRFPIALCVHVKAVCVSKSRTNLSYLMACAAEYRRGRQWDARGGVEILFLGFTK